LNTISAKNRRIRIALLNILKTEYPGAVDLKVLRFAMDNLGYPMPEGMLDAHLRYLEEKGYGHIEMRKGFGFKIAFASLTASGWDLLDGLILEKGVDEEL
jgi:hypothetical protein